MGSSISSGTVEAQETKRHPLSIELECSVPSGDERRCRGIVTLENFTTSNKEDVKSENNAGEEVHLDRAEGHNLPTHKKQARSL